MNEKQLSGIKPEHRRAFEDICQHGEGGHEFWSARDLQIILGYVQWRRFEEVIVKAKTACQNSSQVVENHFAEVGKMVSLNSKYVQNLHMLSHTILPR